MSDVAGPVNTAGAAPPRAPTAAAAFPHGDPPAHPAGAPAGAPARPGSTRPGRAAPVYRGLPRWVRAAAWIAIAVAVGIVVGATAPEALRRLGAVAAVRPSILPWYAVRATGFLAYLAVAGSVVYGLMLSTKLLDAIAHRPVTIAIHKDLSLVAVGLSLVHGALLLADQTFAFGPAALLVPFTSPYAPLAVGAGQLAFYALAVVTASFYVRRRIGQRAWRLLHYLTFATFAGATWHGIAAGSDSGARWALWLYLVPAAAAAFLFTYRAVTAVGARAMERRAAGRRPFGEARRPLGEARLSVPEGRRPAGADERRRAGLDHPARTRETAPTTR